MELCLSPHLLPSGPVTHLVDFPAQLVELKDKGGNLLDPHEQNLEQFQLEVYAAYGSLAVPPHGAPAEVLPELSAWHLKCVPSCCLVRVSAD